MLFIHHFRASLIMLLFSQFFKMEASQLKMKMSIIYTVGSRQAHVSAAEVIAAFLKQYYDKYSER